MKEGETEQLKYAHWLYHTVQVRKKLWRAVEEIGTPKEIYEAGEKRLLSCFTEKQVEDLLMSKKTWNLQLEWEKLEEKKIKFIPFFHKQYPKRLKHIPDMPWAIYEKGRRIPQKYPCVAVVGARQCSVYGRRMAEQIGRILGENHIPLISGMARGVDGISQYEALMADGESVGVLGCGVDVCYPRENRKLYEMLEEKGTVVSEYLPGTQPLGSLFPQRNRIISGLCDILVVVEAKEKSGTLITVDMALEQGREVMAVPGRVQDALSFGCNNLIKQGAAIMTSPEDILHILGKNVMEENSGKHKKENRKIFSSDEEKRVYEILDYLPKNIEEIWNTYGKDKITVSQLMRELLELCMKGYAVEVGGNYGRSEI